MSGYALHIGSVSHARPNRPNRPTGGASANACRSSSRVTRPKLLSARLDRHVRFHGPPFYIACAAEDVRPAGSASPVG